VVLAFLKAGIGTSIIVKDEGLSIIVKGKRSK